jgi:hypothetical protein
MEITATQNQRDRAHRFFVGQETFFYNYLFLMGLRNIITNVEKWKKFNLTVGKNSFFSIAISRMFL